MSDKKFKRTFSLDDWSDEIMWWLARKDLTSVRLACSLMVVLFSSFMMGHKLGNDYARENTPPAVTAPLPPTDLVANVEPPSYSHAIVEHGIHDPATLEQAYHTTGQFTQLDRGTLAYTTYRRGSHIFWTKVPIFLPAGTGIIKTAQGDILTRCGNRISPLGQEPTELGPDPLLTTLANPLTDDLEPVGAPEPIPGLPVLAFVPQEPLAPTSATGGYFGGPFIPWVPGAVPSSRATPEPSLVFMLVVGLALMLVGKRIKDGTRL